MINIEMHDGSRQFASLPQTASWYEVRDHVGQLHGARLVAFLTDHVTEAWIDFAFSGHHFSINDQMGDYWLFVADPKCPDETLHIVANHFAVLLAARDQQGQ